MQAYFEEDASLTPRVLLSNLLIFALGVFSVVCAHQILMGWFPIGPRSNVSRHDLNNLEILISAGAIVLALAAFRTAWGILTREHAGWAWTQWVSLAGIVVGFGLGMNAVLDWSSGGHAFNDALFATGAVVFVLSGFVYTTATRGAEFTPEQYFRIQLAESPSSGAIIGFVVIFLGFSMASALFLEPTSVASILTNNATKGIIAIGVTILMISGEFDLSVGSVVGTSGMIFMVMMTEVPEFKFLGITLNLSDGSATSVWIAAATAMLWAAMLGLINGLIFALTRIPSFIVTLGTLFAYRAVSLVVIAGGRILRYRDTHDQLPQMTINRWFFIVGALALLLALLYTMYRAVPGMIRSFVSAWGKRRDSGSFGTTQALLRGLWFLVGTAVFSIVGLWLALVAYYHFEHRGETLRTGAFDIMSGRWAFTLHEVSQGKVSITIPSAANFQNTIIWWVLLVIFFQIILVHTRYGNAVFAVGGNIGAATAQGIRASRVKVQNFVLCSFLAGVAGIFETARSPSVDPLKGDTWELQVIAMTVIGGSLLSGGYGSIIGTALGVLIFGMLQTGLVLVGMDARMFQGVIGVIMIIAVVLNNMTKRR